MPGTMPPPAIRGASLQRSILPPPLPPDDDGDGDA
jgi:hypothetical protein